MGFSTFDFTAIALHLPQPFVVNTISQLMSEVLLSFLQADQLQEQAAEAAVHQGEAEQLWPEEV